PVASRRETKGVEQRDRKGENGGRDWCGASGGGRSFSGDQCEGEWWRCGSGSPSVGEVAGR
ncbi:hypothetical protein A2U01_0066499, partial [Trifolium medium]|nr:hypothetical protein [Trifolium medium]